jgi:hypothetical protein
MIRCIALRNLRSPLTRCTNKTVEGKLLCTEHLERGRKEKIAVLVIPEILDRIKSNYPHTAIELKFDKD